MINKKNCTYKKYNPAGAVLAAALLSLVFAFPLSLCGAKAAAGGLTEALVHECAAEETVIDVAPGDLSYAVGADRYQNCVVTGLSPEWTAENPGGPGNRPKLRIKIPAVWENEGVEYSVRRVAENAFRCGSAFTGGDIVKVDYILNYSVVSVDFSEALNLNSIEAHAFDGTDIATLDLPHGLMWIHEFAFAACGRLKNIDLTGTLLVSVGRYAFAFCGALEVADLRTETLWDEIGEKAFWLCSSLKTVYLGGARTLFDLFGIIRIELPPLDFDFGENLFNRGSSEYNVQNIVFYDKKNMDIALTKRNLQEYSEYFTYEQEAVFDANGGEGKDGAPLAQRAELKLFNRPIDYVKRENGAWERDGGYTLPSPGIKDGCVYRWTAAESAANLRAGSDLAGETLYRAVWTNALKARLELPAGFVLYTDKTPADLAEYVRAEYMTDGYTSSAVKGFTVSYGNGAERFAAGENIITVSYGGCSAQLIVMAEPRPSAVPGRLPAWAYWLIGAGAFLALCAAAAVWYGFKKKGIFVRETTVIKTETVEVVRSVPVTEGRPLPMDRFTAAEKRVAELLLLGRTRREIAEELGLAENTVKVHTRNVYDKAEVGNQKALMARYLYDKDFFG